MRLILLVALVAVLAGGCTASRPGTPATPSRPPAGTAADGPPPLAAAARSFPLDRYMLKPAEANDLDVVADRLTRACMQRFGQSWQGGVRNEFDLLRDRANRFGLADEGLASSLGYHWDVAAPAPAGLQQRRYLDGAAPAVPNLPAGGCSGESARRLGWAPAEFAWLSQLNDQTLRQTYAAPRATAVTQRWSACMAETGSPYARPADAAADRRWNGKPAPSADEKRVAVADVRCKRQVGFSEELSAVLADQQARAVRDNQDRLDAFRRMAARAVARADALRGDHGSAPAPGARSTPLPPGNWRTEHAPA